MTARADQTPTACLALADGTVFYGTGFGATGIRVAELCFNTAMTGYQEIMTDPSYAGQVVTFTFPHIGNTGTNNYDIESIKPAAKGLVIREDITQESNFRATNHFQVWLQENKLVGICGVDTRHITHILRENGSINAAIVHKKNGMFGLKNIFKKISQEN